MELPAICPDVYVYPPTSPLIALQFLLLFLAAAGLALALLDKRRVESLSLAVVCQLLGLGIIAQFSSGDVNGTDCHTTGVYSNGLAWLLFALGALATAAVSLGRRAPLLGGLLVAMFWGACIYFVLFGVLAVSDTVAIGEARITTRWPDLAPSNHTLRLIVGLPLLVPPALMLKRLSRGSSSPAQ